MSIINQYGLMLDRSNDSHPRLVKEVSHTYAGGECFNSPERIVDMLNTCVHLSSMAEEYLYLVVMDAATRTVGLFSLSHGSALDAPLGIREMFIRILLCGGVCFALVHNHPSGKTEPSKEDRAVCRRVAEASELMMGGGKMVDFIIVGDGTFFSFNRECLL